MSTLSAATEVSYRLLGKSARGSPHKAIIPGKVSDPEAARLALESLLNAVEAVQIVETFYRPVIVDAGAPPPLVVPPPAAPPHVHVLDISEAWEVGVWRLERWNLHSGHELLLPVAMADDLRLVANFGHPQTFAPP